MECVPPSLNLCRGRGKRRCEGVFPTPIESWPRRTAHKARVFVEIVPWLRGTALATLVPVAGNAPLESATGVNGARWVVTEAICAALLERLATGARTSCETNGGFLDSAVGGRVECAVPPSSCHWPVRKVPGWRAFGFPLGVWAASRRIPGEAEKGEEAGDGGTSPWCPDVYGVLGVPM